MTARGRSALRLELVFLAVAAAVLALRIASMVAATTDWPGPFVDWHTYVNAVQRLFAGEPIYAASQLDGPYQLVTTLLVGYSYPPASVPLFIPFVGYPLGLALWLTLNIGLLVTALWALVSPAWPGHRVGALALVLLLLAWFPPFTTGVVAANVNVGIAGLVGWIAVGLSGRVAGVAGGLGVIVKVFVGVAALASRDKLRPALLAAGVASALVVVTLPLVGATAWTDFVHAMSNAVPFCQPTNFSIACRLAPIVGEQAAIYVGIAIGALAALTLLVSTRPLTMAVLTAVVVMAPALDMHWHYWTIAFVIAVAAVAERYRRKNSVVRPTTVPAPLNEQATDLGETKG
jgi:hypothetical protein